MCRIYNRIGSLTSLKSNLEQNNIHDFKSLKEVMDFQKSYRSLRGQLISHHEKLIEQERELLYLDLPNIEIEIEKQRQHSVQRLINEIGQLKQQLHRSICNNPTSFFQKLVNGLKHWSYTRLIKRKENSFEVEVQKSISKLVADYEIKSNRYQFISSCFDNAVKESAQSSLSELESKKSIIDGLNNYIYGAIGEQKVVKTLEALSDEYFLINDFTVSFSPAIYNRQENDYIQSVQIDHILVGPSGIFIIETKNWSEKSLENLSLRSPVEQIKRASFALFYMLNNDKSKYYLDLEEHHWGSKKVPIKNLIVLTNTKPTGEFQYVKTLTISELLSYVNYFKPIFSSIDTKKIADIILQINDTTEK